MNAETRRRSFSSSAKHAFTEASEIVESYLDRTSDPMSVEMAFKVLCLYWHRTAQYLDRISDFIEPKSWDDEGYLRLTALTAAGAYLAKASNPGLLKRIFQIFSDPREENLVRGEAYRAMGRAAGVMPPKLPGPGRISDFEHDVDHKIVDWVREQVRQG